VNGLSALLLVLTGVTAVVDWVAVSRAGKPVEYVAKPLTMVLLIAAVTSFDEVDNDGARIAFVIALLWSMLGDVFLMLPDRERWFVFGLGAFLVGHLAYIPGLWILGTSTAGLVVGVALVGVALVGVGRRIISGVGEREPRLVAPVIAYISVISAMVASAVATGRPIAIAGAVLFYSSDALIAWTSFVEEKRWGKLAIIITYHAGQVGLALALL
jgi:uncharacterized membrane protein YhhN